MTAKRTVKNLSPRAQIEHLKGTIERMKAERGTIETKDELIEQLRTNLREQFEDGAIARLEAKAEIERLQNIELKQQDKIDERERQVRLLEHEVQFLRGLVCAITGRTAPTSPQLSPPRVIEEWLEKCRHAGPKGEGWPPHHTPEKETDYWTCPGCGTNDATHADWCAHR